MKDSRLNLVFFYIFLILVSIWFVIPFFQIGLFCDGIAYGTIARNLIFEPQTSIWDLKVAMIDPSLNGHPPLAFWMESFFFKIFGDQFCIEKLYSFLMFLLTSFILYKLAILYKIRHPWLVLILWLLIPIVAWTFNNNMLENTLGIYTTGSIYCLSLYYKRPKNNFKLILASILLFLASMVKGPIGLFPLAFPFFYYLVYRENSFLKMVLDSLLIIMIIILLYLLLFGMSSRALEFYIEYFHLQILGSIKNASSGYENGRYYILSILLQETLIIVSLTILIMSGLWLKKKRLLKPKKEFYLFGLIGLSASLPIMLSMKQINFYIVPASCFIAFAFAIYILQIISELDFTFSNIVLKYSKIVAGLVLITCLALSVYQFGTYSRDKVQLADLKLLSTIIHPKSVVYLDKDLSRDWSLYFYAYRYYYINVFPFDLNQTYALVLKGHQYPNYNQLVLEMKNYNLYKRD